MNYGRQLKTELERGDQRVLEAVTNAKNKESALQAIAGHRTAAEYFGQRDLLLYLQRELRQGTTITEAFLRGLYKGQKDAALREIFGIGGARLGAQGKAAD